MGSYTVSMAAIIPAPPAKVYRILADYHRHHPKIVPPEHFRNFQVLAGGVGAGTRTRFQVRVLGSVREVNHVVSEPEPGRVLMEAVPDGSSPTRFILEPSEGGERTRLTIATELASRSGAAGAVERWVTSMALRRIYRKELARIAAYAPGATI
jgi:hypothetical protein